MGLSLAQRIDPSRAILLVIDMQNDFCHSEAPPANAAGTWPSCRI
jgi:nicotinamidase-related amidase